MTSISGGFNPAAQAQFGQRPGGANGAHRKGEHHHHHKMQQQEPTQPGATPTTGTQPQAGGDSFSLSSGT